MAKDVINANNMNQEQKFMESWTPDLKNENGEFYEKNVAVVATAKEVKAPLVFTGETFEHGRFGIGKKISETADTIQLYFENFGEKNLLKKFANLKSI